MREQLQKRLRELKQEYESGQKMLAELEEKRNSLQNTMLRISGAMQVLEEQLKAAGQSVGESPAVKPEINNHDEALTAE